MSSEPKYEKVIGSCKVSIGTTQVVVESELPTEQMKTAKKILCANAKGYISKCEVVGNVVNYEGYVVYQVVYEDEEDVKSVDYTAEIKDKYTLTSDMYGQLTCYINCELIDISTNITPNAIKVNSIFELSINAIQSTEYNALVGFEDENVYAKTESVEFTTFLGKVEEKFDDDYDLEIKDNILKILSVCPTAYIESVKPSNQFLKINGSICIDILYLANEEQSMPRSYQKIVDFEKEIAYDSLNENSTILNTLNIILNEVKVSSQLDESSAIVNVKIPMQYVGFVFNKTQLETILDVYSSTNYVNTTFDNFNYLVADNGESFSDKISTTASIDESNPFIDEVIGTCCNNVVVANTMFDDSGLVVEGVASVNVLYNNKELNSISTIIVEMPFSITLNTSNTTNPLLTLALTDVTAKGKRGKDIEVNGTIQAYLQCYDCKNEVFLSKVEMGEVLPEDECNLYIYIVQDGETIWDIAKKFGISTELILELNPEIALPLSQNDRIVIFKPQILEF